MWISTSLPLGEFHAAFIRQNSSLVLCALFVFPLVAWDMLKLTHRVAGPLYRFRRVLEALVKSVDVIVINAKVTTLDKSNPVAEAVAIRDGKIVISGTTSGPNLDDAELTRIFFLQLSVVGSTMGTRDELASLLLYLDRSGCRDFRYRLLDWDTVRGD